MDGLRPDLSSEKFEIRNQMESEVQKSETEIILS